MGKIDLGERKTVVLGAFTGTIVVIIAVLLVALSFSPGVLKRTSCPEGCFKIGNIIIWEPTDDGGAFFPQFE